MDREVQRTYVLKNVRGSQPPPFVVPKSGESTQRGPDGKNRKRRIRPDKQSTFFPLIVEGTGELVTKDKKTGTSGAGGSEIGSDT